MLTDSSRTKFMTGYVNEGPQARSQYAYGWAVMKTSRGTRLVTHSGSNGVYVAELLRFVDDKVTIFVASTVSELTATQAVAVVSKIECRAFERTITLDRGSTGEARNLDLGARRFAPTELVPTANGEFRTFDAGVYLPS